MEILNNEKPAAVIKKTPIGSMIRILQSEVRRLTKENCLLNTEVEILRKKARVYDFLAGEKINE